VNARAFFPAVSSADSPPSAALPTRCADEAGASGNQWYQTPGALSIILAIGTANTLAEQLERTADLPGTPYSVREAADQIGTVAKHYGYELPQHGNVHQLIGRIKPSNGNCVASSLWGALGELRGKAIRDQLKAEGVPVYYDMQPWDSGADEAQARYDELDRDLSTVEAALQAMGVGL
jgi:hypothetical protein